MLLRNLSYNPIANEYQFEGNLLEVHYHHDILKETVNKFDDISISSFVVPLKKSTEILLWYHDYTLVSQSSWKETFRAIWKIFYWKGLKDCEKICRSKPYIGLYKALKLKIRKPFEF